MTKTIPAVLALMLLSVASSRAVQCVWMMPGLSGDEKIETIGNLSGRGVCGQPAPSEDSAPVVYSDETTRLELRYTSSDDGSVLVSFAKGNFGLSDASLTCASEGQISLVPDQNGVFTDSTGSIFLAIEGTGSTARLWSAESRYEGGGNVPVSCGDAEMPTQEQTLFVQQPAE